MSKITVNCPKCRQEVTIERAALNASQGRVDCLHCAHVFHLVKKSKKATDAVAATMQPEKKSTPKGSLNYREPQAKTIVKEELMSIEDMFMELTDKPARQKQTVELAAKAKTASRHRRQKPLTYRIPKAPTLKKNDFAEVGVGNDAVAFNLLDHDSINAQVPQVSVQPTGSALPVPAVRVGEPQNNITIHTDSLVFTLIGDGQNNMANLPQSLTGLTQVPVMGNSAVPSQNVVAPTPMAATPSSEFNWTVATIGAFLVLIVQLFNFILMLI